MRTQAESTYIVHNIFGQTKMEITWNNRRHTLINRKRGGKPRMISGQFVVVRVGVHQLSVSANTSHPMLGAVEKNMLLILDIINHQYYTGHRWGNYFNSMSLSQNVGCEHEV